VKNLRERLDIHNSDVPVLCRSCEARHRGVCGALSPEQLVRLGRQTIKFDLKPEQAVSASQPDSERYANILKGIVKLTKIMSDGRQQIVGLQFAPDFVGRPFGKQSDITGEAVTNVKVCSFPKKALDELIQESPDLERKLYEQSLRELDEAREWMLTLGRKTAAEKVASFLHLLALHSDPEADDHGGKIQFEIPMKRSDVADFLGLTIETVSRQLTKLRLAKVIEIKDNRFVAVQDIRRLQQLMDVDSSGF
jgi:CRP/FNR family transcriptional regulator